MMSSTSAAFIDPTFITSAPVAEHGTVQLAGRGRETVRPLSQARVGQGGVIRQVGGHGAATDPAAAELERRLLELGFVEGARIEVLHQGAFGGCPIAVRLDDMRIALRRREAEAVSVLFDPPGRPGPFA